MRKLGWFSGGVVLGAGASEREAAELVVTERRTADLTGRPRPGVEGLERSLHAGQVRLHSGEDGRIRRGRRRLHRRIGAGGGIAFHHPVIGRRCPLVVHRPGHVAAGAWSTATGRNTARR